MYWTAEDDRRVLELRSRGLMPVEIAPLVGRSKTAVDYRLWKLTAPIEQLQAEHDRKMFYERARRRKSNKFKHILEPGGRAEPPPAALAERDHAYAGYSGARAAMGEPPIGRSALDKLDGHAGRLRTTDHVCGAGTSGEGDQQIGPPL